MTRTTRSRPDPADAVARRRLLRAAGFDAPPTREGHPAGGWAPGGGDGHDEEPAPAARAQPTAAPPARDAHHAARPPAPYGLLAWLRAARYDPGLPGVAVLVAVAVAAAALAGWFLLGSRPTPVPAPPPQALVEQVGTADGQETASDAMTGGASSDAAATEVVVAVTGTVVRPGVVRLPVGSRVVDAVDAAGGVLPGADIGLLNLARVLADGEQVLVGVEPPAGAAAAAGAVADPVVDSQGRLDLNRATVADLDELPGVGPVLAERILAHRERAGRFDSVEQLRDVDGIGESRYADLQERVVVP